MKPFTSRWRIKGKLKVVLILLFVFSLLFMSYQVLYYASLNQYQSEESEAQIRYRHNIFQSGIREDKKLKGETKYQIKPVPAKLDSHDLSIKQEDQSLQYRPGKPVSSKVLGVAPEYWSRYTSNLQRFACFTSKTVRIPWDRVNDDYCDCPFDGSDEPSTSACMNGKFYCTKSTKSYPDYVPSSRVNDGICDCCDGSEEYLTKSSSVGSDSPYPVGKSGYYMDKDVFGQHGDFITSPEISQLFGEMLGVWGIETWRRIGGPKKFSIVELGPGRGTLAKDILRVFCQLNRFTGNDISLHMVEISPFLAQIQAQTLCGSESSSGVDQKISKINPASEGSDGNSFYHQGVTRDTNTPVYWYRDITNLPQGFHFYIAHEFFDALPVHKLQKVDNNWREVLIDLDPEMIKTRKLMTQQDTKLVQVDAPEKLRFVISRHETPIISLLRNYYSKIVLDSRSHIEVSLAAIQIYEELTKRLENDGGMGLIIDYGHQGTKGDTFRGFYRHALHDPLVRPGTADLTADVDFSIIHKVCQEKAFLAGTITQRELLSRVGIDVRLKKLLAQCTTEEDRKQLTSGYTMLMDDMGERFKCLAMFPKVLEDFRPALKISAFDDMT